MLYITLLDVSRHSYCKTVRYGKVVPHLGFVAIWLQIGYETETLQNANSSSLNFFFRIAKYSKYFNSKFYSAILTKMEILKKTYLLQSKSNQLGNRI